MSARQTQALRADIGIASPVGWFGLAYSLEPTPHLLLELGAGLGISGLQLSAMPKLVLGSRDHRFTPGLGLSLGVPVGTIGLRRGSSDDGERVLVPWLNADLLAYDYRSRGGFSFTAAAGLTVALAHGCAVVFDSCKDAYGTPYPQVRLGVGHSF